MNESSDVLFRLNDFEFDELNSADFVGLNSLDTDYRLSLFSDSVRDSESSYVADVLLHGSDTVRLSMVNNLLDKFHVYLDNDSELFYLDGYAGIERLSLIAGNSGAITLSKYHDLGIGILTDALNDLVVSGNMVIGESYSGVYSADPNSIIVESKLGVGTPLPLYTSDIRGTVVIGDISPGSDIANSLIIEDQLFVEEYGNESVVAMGAIGLDGDLFFKDSDNELSFMNGDGEFVIGYSDSFYSTNLRSLNVISSSEIQLYPTSSTVGFYINSVGNVNFGHEGVNINNNFHIEMDELNLKIHQSDSGDYGDAQIEFESLNDGVIGLDSNYNNGSYQYFIISDEEILEDSITGEASQGADIQIDSDGNVDIGYNMHDSDENADMPDSSDQFRLDVNASMFSTQYGIAQNSLTHMPIGSVIMWSGWTTELPEGWKFCTGVPSETTTDACNFIDQFIVGYDPSIGRSSLNPDGSSYVGSDSLTISSSDGSSTFAESFEHTHDSSWDSSSHDHAVNGTVSHGHSSNNTVEYYGSAGLGTATVSSSLASTGQQYITVAVKYWYEDCFKMKVGFKVKLFCETKSAWRNETHTNTTHGATYAAQTSHNHTVTVDHNHSYSFNNESSHKHTMDTLDHSHPNSLHTHYMDNRPSFYTLAFIYLEGE